MVEVSAQLGFSPLQRLRAKRPNAFWARNEEAIRRKVGEGATISEMASALGVSYQVMRLAVIRLGLAVPRKNIVVPKDRYREVVDLRESGLTYQQIGDRFGVSGECVRQILHSAGRSDLCFRQKRSPCKPRIEVGECAYCEAPLFRTESAAKVLGNYCGRECYTAMRRKVSPTRRRALIACRRRRAGLAWADIAIELGVKHGETLNRAVKTYFRWTGRPAPSGVFGVYNRSRKK